MSYLDFASFEVDYTEPFIAGPSGTQELVEMHDTYAQADTVGSKHGWAEEFDETWTSGDDWDDDDVAIYEDVWAAPVEPSDTDMPYFKPHISFPQFGKLPVELQRKIFRHATAEAVVGQRGLKRFMHCGQPEDWVEPWMRTGSRKQDLASLLLVNKSVRDEVRKFIYQDNWIVCHPEISGWDPLAFLKKISHADLWDVKNVLLRYAIGSVQLSSEDGVEALLGHPEFVQFERYAWQVGRFLEVAKRMGWLATRIQRVHLTLTVTYDDGPAILSSEQMESVESRFRKMFKAVSSVEVLVTSPTEYNVWLAEREREAERWMWDRW